MYESSITLCQEFGAAEVAPFLLPNNIKEGDYIELGQLGAYGLTFRTKFNGFYSDNIVEVNDRPIMSLHEDANKVNYLVA